MLTVFGDCRRCQVFPRAPKVCFDLTPSTPHHQMASNGAAMMQTGIFEDLQHKIDEDTAVKDVGRSPENRLVFITSHCVHRLCGTSSSRSKSKVPTKTPATQIPTPAKSLTDQLSKIARHSPSSHERTRLPQPTVRPRTLPSPPKLIR